jgi:hypothetical protein
MKKNDVFTFTAPNGVEVTGVVIDCLSSTIREEDNHMNCKYLCYAQNRLFTYLVEYKQEPVAVDHDEFGNEVFDYGTVVVKSSYEKELVGYCVIPYYDGVLEAHNYVQSI